MTPVASRFRLARARLPQWMKEGDAELVGYSLDLTKDAWIERIRLGHLVRFPQQDPDGTPAPPDALASHGRDRRVVRGINETAEDYAARMIPWLDDRKTTGNPFALMQKLAEYTGPIPRFRTVDARGNWFTRDADGSISWKLKAANWNWDNRPTTPVGRTRWSRFWVIIYPNGLWVPNRDWGDAAGPDWGEQLCTWGSTATADEVATVRAIVADWMPAGTRCVNIVLAFDPASFDPTAAVDASGMPNGLWEHWGRTVNGVRVAARLSTARYWDGVTR